MRVLVTGATGFIGRALVPALIGRGHSAVALTRSRERALDRLGAEPEIATIPDGDSALAALVAQVERCDAVVSLAGEPVIGARWTAARRERIVASRAGLTEKIVRAIGLAKSRPRAFVSASAVGFYGDRGDAELGEDAAAGDGFLARTCVAWEDAARAAESLGVRVARMRIGIVLGREGGALATMLPAFRAGVGGPLGSGRQFVPWVHLHDVVRMFATALDDERFDGAINCSAPAPATSREFARALGRAVRRPAIIPVPALALRAAFGDAASAMLASQRALPRRLEALGFRFAFPSIDSALADVTGAPGITIERAGAGFELRASARLDAPISVAFPFFSNARNLGAITPAAVRFHIIGDVPEMRAGALIDYTLRISGFPMHWRTRIESWEPGRRFVDVQERGPYREWRHEHSFAADGGGTRMEDHVRFAAPLGSLGRLATPIVVAPMLRRIFAYRNDVIRARFSSSSR